MNGANFRGTRFVHVAALFAALGSLFQLAVAAGIVSAYLVDYAFATVGGWRWMLGLAVAPALVFGAGMFFLPETPIWLIRSGRHEIARSVLLRIRDNADVDLEIAEIQTSLAQMTIVAMLLVDRAGRRPLLLIGIAGMIVTLAVLAFGFHGTNQSNNLAWIAVICLMSYVASFAVSLGPIFWLLIAEIYPLKVGGLAEGTAATFNWASNLIVSLTFLTLLEKLGPSSMFALYAFASVASWLFAYYLVPETKGRPLEQIEAFWRTT